MGETGLSQLLLELLEDPDTHEQGKGLLRPTPSCPPLPRFRSALLREDWTDVEQRHKAGCDVCRRTEAQTRRQVWHPSLLRLFWHVRNLLDDADAAHHLQNDSCRRCQRVAILLQADRLLARLAARVRQRVADTAPRLGRM